MTHTSFKRPLFLAILGALFFMSLTSPGFADKTNFTVNYSWTNTDPEGTAPTAVSDRFAVGDTLVFRPVSVTGFAVDNTASRILQTDVDGNVNLDAPYTDIINNLHFPTVDAYLAYVTGTHTKITAEDLGGSQTYKTVLTPNDETVTVNYVSTDGKKLDSKTINTKFSRTVPIAQPTFSGYTIMANQPTSYTVTQDGADQNVVTITYELVASSSSNSSSSSSSSTSGPGASSTNSESSTSTSTTHSSAVSNATQQSSSVSAVTMVPAESHSSHGSGQPTSTVSKQATLPETGKSTTHVIGGIIITVGVLLLGGTGYHLIKKQRN
ncbi:LPXTG cell wall anchor domain-containing protein [Furfurilactobacillus entadae]|uniref:LPXTG cell wall anchor domain-containing protein n=1 Tax=Furfurilactobacillus entadae TaxID=2922307 RepID=UPI0035E52FDA